MPGDDDYLLMIRAFRACIFSQMKSSFGKLSSRDDLNLKENRYCLLLVVVKKIFGPRSCISELQLKVNCRENFWATSLLAVEVAQIFLPYNLFPDYNSLSTAIHL